MENDEAIQDFAHGRRVKLDSDKSRVLVWNRSRTVAALVLPDNDPAGRSYKPDKVFFLDKSNDE
jgi:hypothetical protein